MFKSLSFVPKNPRHFCSVLFILQKEDKRIRETTVYLKKVGEFSEYAIFECAYGFFSVNRKGEYSSHFFKNIENVLLSEKKTKITNKISLF